MLAAAVFGFALGIALAPVWLGWWCPGLAVLDALARCDAGGGTRLLVGVATASAATGLAVLVRFARRADFPPVAARWLLASTLVLPGLAWAIARHPRPAPDDVMHLAPRRHVTIEAVVATPPARTDDGWRARLAVVAVDSFPPGPRCGWLEASWPGAARPRVGACWTFAGHLDRPRGPANPGESDRAARLARQGVFAVLHAQSAGYRRDQAGWAFARALDVLRVRLLDGLGTGLAPARAALLGSLVLGTGASPVDPVLADHFRSIGLSHLLAASGAQVGMLSAVAYAGARGCGLGPAWAAGLTLPGLLVYLALTGAPASMVRATWMGAVGLGALALERTTAPFAALWLAAGAMLVLDPGALWDLGFQFSFLATYALCRLAADGHGGHAPPEPAAEDGWPRRLGRRLAAWAAASLRISWAANAWVLPLQLAIFQQGSLLALPANLLAEPLVLLLTPWGVGVAVAGAVWPPLAGLASPLTNLLLALLETLVDALAAVPWGGFTCPTLPVATVALAYLALWCGRQRPRAMAGTVAVAGVVAMLPMVHATRLELAVLSIGQGDAIVVHAPGDHWLVVDAGPAFRGQDAGEQILVPYLRREGCHHVDLVVATHAHLDHIGGLPALLHDLPVRQAWDPGQWDHGRPYLDLLAGWLMGGVPWAIATQNTAWEGGGAHLEVLSHPAPALPLNDGSIVTQLRFGAFRALLMGDTEAAGEARLLASGADLRADVLKVGHHGSRTSSTPALLAATRPRLAVISVGVNNRFGHPDAEVVTRLARTGALVTRTDRDGATLVRTDGTGTWLATGVDGWSSWRALPPAPHARFAMAPAGIVK